MRHLHCSERIAASCLGLICSTLLGMGKGGFKGDCNVEEVDLKTFKSPG